MLEAGDPSVGSVGSWILTFFLGGVPSGLGLVSSTEAFPFDATAFAAALFPRGSIIFIG